MDKNENVEMLVGDKNDTFPKGGSTGLGSGYDNHMNQYTWQTTVHEGNMYLSTMNTTTLLEPIAQFTNGDILKHQREGLEQHRPLPARVPAPAVGHGPDRPGFRHRHAEQRSERQGDHPDHAVHRQSGGARRLGPHPGRQGRLRRAAADHRRQVRLVRQAISLTAAQTKELVDGIKDGSIVPGSLAASGSSDEASQLFDINNELDNLGSQLSDKGSADFANNYGEVTDAFFSIADIIPDKFKGLYEMLVKLTSKANLKAYAKSLPYLAKSKRGFNLFEITDRSAANEGVTVGTVTDNGFGDPFNHGLRIYTPTTTWWSAPRTRSTVPNCGACAIRSTP